MLTRCAEFQPWVASVKRRIVDLHLPFKRFDYYLPAQRGSTSIKAVMPALTERGYDELEIKEGNTASLEFMRVTFTDVLDEERQRVRRQSSDWSVVVGSYSNSLEPKRMLPISGMGLRTVPSKCALCV